DVYNRLVYVDGYERFAQRHPELREQTVVIESFSKPWAMTGWRLGWLAAAAPVIAEIAKAHQYLVSSAVSFEMDAAARALTVDPTPMLEVYRARRERVLAALDAMGLDVVEPAGAFYTFPSIKKFGLTSEDFCIKAIKEANVALVPGDCFGTEGHIRLSYCVPTKTWTKASAACPPSFQPCSLRDATHQPTDLRLMSGASANETGLPQSHRRPRRRRPGARFS
ncbi:MAG: pyridoxal phosphate-dependent aminotransferase, partial [Collinsella sp.]